MEEFNFRVLIVSFLLINIAGFIKGLKCRTSQEMQENSDLEYVVRMCLRHINNETDFIDQFYRNQDGRDRNDNRNGDGGGDGKYNNRNRDGNDYNSNYNGYGNNNQNGNGDNNGNGNQDNRNSDGFDTFWSFGNQQQHSDRNGYGDEDRGRRDFDYGDESDYYNNQKNNNKGGRNRYNSMPSYPHSYQQQMQRDRDVGKGHNPRDSSGYFTPNSKQGTNLSHLNRDGRNDSPLADIEPCVIHCIFQEMKMVDDDGKPRKELISYKMTQKIRDPELKNFIRESVEECYRSLEEYEPGNRRNGNGGRNHRGNQQEMCEWAKTFAMCLESRGKDNCEDWNYSMTKTNKNNNSSNSNNNNNAKSNNKNNKKNNNNNNNKNNENQRNKPKETG